MTFATDAPSADTGPGFLSFVAFFLLALALWFLMRNMNARMRRMSYRQQAAGRGKNDPQADGGTVVAASSSDTRPDDGPGPGRGDGPDPSPSPSPSPSHGSDGSSSDGGGSGGGGDGGGGGGD